MGKYFGREPRYSREEIERQAQEAIDARVREGRPPAEEWRPLLARLAEIDRVKSPSSAFPPVLVPQPMQLHEIRMPLVPAAPVRLTWRRPVAARHAAD